MTTFNYSTGDPTTLDESQTASMANIKNSFTDIATFINGSNLDSNVNLATTPFAVYNILDSADVSILAGDLNAVNKYYILGGLQFNYFYQSGSTSPGTYGSLVTPINITDFNLLGKTQKLRLNVTMSVSTTSSVVHTFGLYPITSNAGSSGNSSLTMGTVTSGSTLTITPSSASTIYQTIGSDFDFPSAGNYVMGVSVPSSSGAAGAVRMVLEYHYV